MLQVDEQFEVASPRARVFRLWSAFGSFPAFMTGVDRVFVETLARMRWRTSIAGVPSSFYAVVTEFEPDERIAWVSVDQETMGWWVDLEALEPDSDGGARTRVTVRVIWSPRGDVPATERAQRLDALAIRLDLQRFRVLAEAPAEERAGERSLSHAA